MITVNICIYDTNENIHGIDTDQEICLPWIILDTYSPIVCVVQLCPDFEHSNSNKTWIMPYKHSVGSNQMSGW